MRLLHHLLAGSADRSAAKVALVCGEERVTFESLWERALRLASALRRRGIDRGDRVAILASNTVETVVAFWGALAVDAVAVPMNPLAKNDKLSWLLEHSGAAALVGGTRLDLDNVLRHGGTLKAVLLGESFQNALATETPMSTASLANEEDLAAIIYTSGSTGKPKGVMLSHRNMLSAAASICEYLGLEHDDVLQCLSPLSFDYGLYQVLLSCLTGARCVLAPPFGLPGQVLKQTEAECVTFFPGVPTHFAMLGALKDVTPWDVSSVRAVTSTGAALGKTHIATIKRIFPRAAIYSMYGLTECKRCTYLPPADLERKPDSVGIAIPGTELWLVDDRDRRLGPGEVGQLVIRGPHVMKGYWRDAEATAEKLRPDTSGERLLYTGDLCRLDDEGYLYFVARTDDIIKSRGEKVAPKEIEAVLLAVDGVSEAVVVGVPDELLGQALKAFVVLRAAGGLSEADLLRACRERLESFMVPRQIEIVSALPKSDNGKIDKAALSVTAW